MGDRWDDVYSQLVRRFDTRTVPGRHVVFCHMLHFIDGYPFFVDEHGILRERLRRRWARGSYWKVFGDENKARRFAGDRRIAARGPAWFWFVPTSANGEPTGRFRQDRRLTPAEEREWTALAPEARAALGPW